MELDIKPLKYELQLNNLFNCESSSMNPYCCELCGDFITDLRASFFAHMDSVHKKPQQRPNYSLTKILKAYRCKNCNFHSFSLLILLKHVFNECTVQTRQPLKCKLCPYEATYPRNLQRHIMLKHLDPIDVEWFNCKHCPFKTKQKGNLKQHVRARHTAPEDVKWFECDQCPHRTITKTNWKLHMMRKHPESIPLFKCHRCSYKTMTEANLNKHVFNKHTRQQVVQKRLQCDQCSYSTLYGCSLKRHVVAKHKDLKDIEWFECEQCTFRSKQKSHLKYHVIAKHTDPEDVNRWFECAHCSYRSKIKSWLTKHIKVHFKKKGRISA